jgi:hypothetical protein
MKSMIGLPYEYRRGHGLLGGWTDVLEDIRALCATFEGLPEVCRCGHGEPHLVRSCPCCGNDGDKSFPSCDDCTRDLSSLRPAIDLMVVDTCRFFPFVKDYWSNHDAAAATRAREIEAQIAALSRSFDMVSRAEEQFRGECRDTHLKALKEAAATLRRDAEALNRIV